MTAQDLQHDVLQDEDFFEVRAFLVSAACGLTTRKRSSPPSAPAAGT